MRERTMKLLGEALLLNLDTSTHQQEVQRKPFLQVLILVVFNLRWNIWKNSS